MNKSPPLYTSPTKTVPSFRDIFHPVGDIFSAFNIHTKNVFVPVSVFYLDDYIYIWTQKWTRPGWIFVLASQILMATSITLFLMAHPE